MPLILSLPEKLGDIYRESLAPWMNASHGVYAGAVVSGFEEFYDLIADDGTDGYPDYVPGWGKILDVDTCPTKYLPFLGQFVGVPNLVGIPDADARSRIRSQITMHRGTPASIVSAAAATLTGHQTVVLTERYGGDPYAIQVITFTSETPDQTVTLAAINTVKPAGIILTYAVYSGWIISSMESFYSGGTISTVEGAWASITSFETNH